MCRGVSTDPLFPLLINTHPESGPKKQLKPEHAHFECLLRILQLSRFSRFSDLTA